MPMYEYRCACGNEAEVYKKITDEEPQLCKDCGAVMERLISQSTFHLKGTGWTNRFKISPLPEDR
jgi:putative FmdB family regulatory protein